MKIDVLSKILRFVLYISLVIMIILLALMPYLVKVAKLDFNLMFYLLYPAGISFIYLITKFIYIFKLLEKDNPFKLEVINFFNGSMVSVFFISFVIFIMTMISIFKYHYGLVFNLCIIFMMILFFGVGIALYILKSLFIKALEYKEEVDLTI